LGKSYRSFEIGNQKYTFNYKKFQECYELLGPTRGKKTEFKKIIKERTNRGIETVRDWISGETGPSDLETIKVLEEIFDVPNGSFLKPLGEDEITKEEWVRMNIPEFERNVARNLYEEMCELIKSAEYIDELLWRDTHSVYKEIDGNCKFHHMRLDNEQRREILLMKIRKAGFDIPNNVRSRLLGMVNQIFGPWNIDNGMMYFESEEYTEYLQKNNFTDCDDIRYLYSKLFVAKLYEELDDIFARYRER